MKYKRVSTLELLHTVSHSGQGFISSSICDKNRRECIFQSSCCGEVETNPTRNHEVAGSIPGLDPWVKDPPMP